MCFYARSQPCYPTTRAPTTSTRGTPERFQIPVGYQPAAAGKKMKVLGAQNEGNEKVEALGDIAKIKL